MEVKMVDGNRQPKVISIAECRRLILDDLPEKKKVSSDGFRQIERGTMSVVRAVIESNKRSPGVTVR